ncbi:MAG TPA: 2-dehydropantoate 2-reductase [Candidatus Dormibacteraeota bacterium]|nr:2-dehydropantoate 2-reductase [Candidatus Dormibacteraeota bacterium]
MTAPADWPKVAVVGAGAVGGYFGGMLARAGAPVVMIGRTAFVEAVKRGGLFLDALQFQERVKVEASADLSAARGAEIVLFCVKTTDNAATAAALGPLLAPGAMVVSMQNGVDNVEQIRAAGIANALPSVVYIGAFVPEPGRVKHTGRGDLVFGPESEQTKKLADLFTRAGVPVRVSSNIEGELWTKFIANCALNAISALSRAKYGQIAGDAETWKLVEGAVVEVLDVARACQVDLGPLADAEKAFELARKIAAQLPEAISSTGQDLMRGKRTEIDSLNGFIARRGMALGIPAPANHTLWALVKLAEAAAESTAAAQKKTSA